MVKMIFFNIGWMTAYQGVESDPITGGGAHIDEYGDGCEVMNFQPYEGFMYGFAAIAGSLSIHRLGAKRGDDSIEKVLVVWVATSPSRGPVAVGWYNNATVYRERQYPPKGSGRERSGTQEWGYRARARVEDCKLLPENQRTFRVPRGKGGMGQANVWYADRPENATFRDRVLKYVSDAANR